ncbi:MAG: AMP-binding protein [bacterium]
MTDKNKPFARKSNPAQQDARWQRFVQQLFDGPEQPFEQHWARFRGIYAGRTEQDGPPLAWQPGKEQLARSNLAVFMKALGFESYAELHRWSVQNRADFWQKVIARLGIRFKKAPGRILEDEHEVKNPCWLPGAELNCVDSCFTANADKPAIISGQETTAKHRAITYGELERLVNQVANGLREHGFEAGAAIALYMPMTVECVAAYLGIVRSGCVVVSIADSFSPTEVSKRLEIANARGIVTVESYVRAGRTIELYEKVKAAAAPTAIVIPAAGAHSGVSEDLRENDLSWAELLSADDGFVSLAADPYCVSNILFSSGTTGTPKAIPWTHLTPIKCAMDGHFHQDIQPQDVVAWPTNIGWMMGPWLIYATFINNATLALYEGAPMGEGFVTFIRQARVAVLGVVPSLVRAWRTSGLLQKAEWDKIKVFSSTGEPSNREDYLWLMSRACYRAPVIEYLGGTEIGGGHITGTVVQPASPATFTTPALGIDFVILDEGGSPVVEGEMGELFLIPPAIGLSQELLNKDHETVYYSGCPAGPNGEVVRRHGDQMARLHKGFYRAQGRADDTMNLGGIKVSSLELEEALDTHEAVYESAAVAVQPEGEGQEKLVVFVVLESQLEKEQLKKELGALIARTLNPLFKIHDLVVVDTLPRTASNKLMRRKLRTGYGEMKSG